VGQPALTSKPSTLTSTTNVNTGFQYYHKTLNVAMRNFRGLFVCQKKDWLELWQLRIGMLEFCSW
jgi:hypothetical protein